MPFAPDCPVDQMAWSGLLECASDEIASLRQSSEYARSEAFRQKIDSLSACHKELRTRIESLRCVPNHGEPSFTLLARDPQSPELVRQWARDRARISPDHSGKVAEAYAVAAEMEEWKLTHPGTGLPSELYKQGLVSLPGDEPFSARG